MSNTHNAFAFEYSKAKLSLFLPDNYFDKVLSCTLPPIKRKKEKIEVSKINDEDWEYYLELSKG